MASEVKYKIFKEIHDEESTRLSELMIRAKVFLSIATFFLGALGIKLTDIILEGHWATKTCYLLAAVSFVVAFLFIILAMAIYSYEGISDLEEVIESFGDEEPDDGSFLDDRLVDLAVACSRNAALNDQRATCLQGASYAMVIGVVFSLLSFLLSATIPEHQASGVFDDHENNESIATSVVSEDELQEENDAKTEST